jgi:radical SAM superfamily enzyme YgiQ (UPF0313 family)
MKVCLIMPPMPFGKAPIAPLALEYLAALTKRAMPDAEVKLLDGNFTSFSPEDIDADLVGISCKTATVTWGYQFADALKKKGIPVVLGGKHPTALPSEAEAHADAVVVGEAESVWSEVLKDAGRGSLKSVYYGEPLPLDNVPFPLRLAGPYKISAIFTARGCPYKCTFCSSRKFYGDTIRYRPIKDVVEEIEICVEGIYLNADENIWVGNTQRAIDLFTALKGSKKKWFGYGDLRSVQTSQGDKLLKAAKESGLISLWVGWEAFSDEGLMMYDAAEKMGRNREEAVKKVKDYGIDVTLSVMLGGRADTPSDFERVMEVADRLGVNVHPALLVPYPGTDLYREYEPFLFKEKGWELYDGAHAVFEHPLPEMSPEAREEKFYQVSLKLLSLGRLFRHLFDIPLTGFPTTHIASLMRQLPVRRGMKLAYQEWQARAKATSDG